MSKIKSKTEKAKRVGPSRQAKSNHRMRGIWRTFGLCNRCGRKLGPGHTSAYCRRNPETRKAQVAAAMRRYRERKKLRSEVGGQKSAKTSAQNPSDL